jgi:Fe-S-cluster-containing dehydrogenase component/DMSO reductase anchor subunit
MVAARLRLPLLDTLLDEQRVLPDTAVERFSRAHTSDGLGGASRYSALIPLAKPAAGQQYAFDVDLDACTGCKACVAGCHSLNGLDDGEAWRTVGLLHGGSPEAPALETITSACHHCLEPACMIGCPVKAYEKDPVTGIVKHLDDQCIGCQYCLFMCPYDAPKYDRKRGIVRKCDMCSDRLAHDEAPACAQACPNQAIRITVVAEAQAIETAQASAFVPGAASPEATLPTTIYRTARARPANLLPADFYAVNPEHAHPALVIMLVLTQLSVGAFCAELLAPGPRTPSAINAWVALGLAVVALSASVFHLGRPHYAFRALLGLRTSWLSREILGFSLFALLAAAYAVARVLHPLGPRLAFAVEVMIAASGLSAVICSIMVYAVTGRERWRAPATSARFLSTTALLGAATVLLTAALSGALPAAAARSLEIVVIAVSAVELGTELTLFRHLRARRHTAHKRSAILLAGELRTATSWRFACGAIGGIALPLIALAAGPGIVLAAASFVLLVAGELLERHLFFAAACAPRMPGGAP